ncbi:MAG: hypothetical protein K1Y36_09030, partial [Blastocatellia bacterium]|nr:hypothetical protein [Blastocatellia bacterium]
MIQGVVQVREICLRPVRQADFQGFGGTLDWGLLFFSGSRLNLKERVRTACGNLVFRHQKFIDRHGTPS